MLVLDVNVVIALTRPDHTQHDLVEEWFTRTVDRGGQGVGVPNLVWWSYLRLVTSRRVFVHPTPVAEAFDVLDALRARPSHVHVEPGQRHHGILRALCADADVTADLVPDAVLAAIAVEHGAAVATFDRDFARFESVRTVRPGA